VHIVVPIKQVPETSNVKMDPDTGTMLREGLAAVINPLDLYALEAALDLREQTGGRITALSMGPSLAEKALREALAIGCDDAVLLSDRAFAGSDTWATAYTLARAIETLGGAEVILCGERATDGDTGQVGPGIAAFLDLPVATYVRRVYDVSDEGLRVERLVEGGTELLWSSLPVVLTVVKEVARPRMPTLRDKLRARRASIPTWGPEEVGAVPGAIGLKGSPTRVVKIDRPQVARRGTILRVNGSKGAGGDVNVDEAAERLVAFLRERHFA
jgi:electron transfer flavoprotein beta subunit